MNLFEPRIIGFLCNWCSYEGSDSAGRAQKTYPHNFLPVKVMCSGRIDPQLILRAFRDGADGVIVLGCHLGECHYKEGNYHMLRRFVLLKKIFSELKIEDERIRLEWVSAGEADRFASIISQMVETLKKLGPMRIFK
ncbi:MAG: hydrogenase iron-sulfur subunit [Bacteroidetes bacterium]|nr:hydrogenase iron-sulfur subunit [Bacteroidota bacterium]